MPLYGLKKIVWTQFSSGNPATGQPYFGPGCADYGAPFPTCAFYKDQMGFVHLKGLMAGPGGSSVNVATLPIGCRPTGYEIFNVIASANGVNLGMRLDIYTDGTIDIYTSSAATWNGSYLSLDGITFCADS